jgi:2-polyprenyl-3-methyl-5-hydroxy-6-metoxy-1,4-benzoquinol methylase
MTVSIPHYNCYLCDNDTYIVRKGTVRDNKELKILECSKCQLVSLSSFDHIGNNFYGSSQGHDDSSQDIESWLKECETDDDRRANYLSQFIKNKSILDFGCGAGGLLIRLKKKTPDLYGVEPELRLKKHFTDHGLTVLSIESLQRIKIKFDYITLFHVLEHIKDPVSILSTLSNMLNDNGKIIIEVPNSQEALICLYESDAYRKFIYWSQHLYLFNEENLISLTEKSNLRLEEIKQIQRYPISNHLYWLACGKPGGHKEMNYMDSISLNNEYQKQLSKLKACDTLLGVFTK